MKMRKTLICGWFSVVIIATATAVANVATDPVHPSLRRMNSMPSYYQIDITCHIINIDVDLLVGETILVNGNETFLGNRKDKFACLEVSDDPLESSFDLIFPDGVELFGNLILGYHSLVNLRNVTLDEENARILFGEHSHAIPLYGPERRRMAKTEGTNKMLVVRVIYRGKKPSLSSSQLAGRVFGLGKSTVRLDMASQLSACSFGKLSIQPVEGVGIEDGVVDIQINQKLTGENTVHVLENMVVKALNGKYNLRDVDHVVLVMPDINLRYDGNSFLAYGYVGASLSVFNDEWAGRLSALIHEVAHNFNLGHSGKDGQTYGDVSGYMGYSTKDVGGPASCFNAQKHWSLGWYADQSLTLKSSDLPWSGALLAFVDYDKAGKDDIVLIELGELYLQYNRAKRMNAGTRAFRNDVVIVKAEKDPSYDFLPPQSWLEDGINSAGKVRTNMPKFQGTRSELIIQVCNDFSSGSKDYVRLNLFLNDGSPRPKCAIDEGSDQCTDDPVARFLVEGIGLKTCSWLAKRAQQSKWMHLCNEDQSAYTLCPESCGRCEVPCEDNNGSFFVNNKHEFRNCNWLSMRPGIANRICVEGHEAFNTCMKTCRRCS